jgi:hypothetical protein
MQNSFFASIFHALILKTSKFLHALRMSISAHGIFLLIMFIYCFAYEILHKVRPDLGPGNLGNGVPMVLVLLLPLLLLGLLMMRFYHVALYLKPESPIHALLLDIRRFLTDPARMANGLPVLVIIATLGFIFSDIQSNVLTLNPNTWDADFAEVEKTLHFGYQPWRLLQPLIGYAPITFLINLNYNMWFFSMMMFLIFFGFARHSNELRTRFILSYLLLWIVGGNILAVIFSSAGPCYFSRLGLSPDPYGDLMTYLRTVNETIPVWAIGFQDALWAGHLHHTDVSEVSAMPSLHNASAMLFTYTGYKIDRFWGRILTAHAILIFVGSIHLAWHYAIDSYVSWFLTTIVWFAMAPVARWWHTTLAQKNFDAVLVAQT